MFQNLIRRFVQWLMGQSTERVVVRLEASVLADLRRNIGGAASSVVTTATTDLQAGYMLGINHVLNTLQEGFTVTNSVTR